MNIVKQSYINRNGAYYNSGGLIEGTQRILISHQSKYWQQGNVENFLAIKPDKIEVKIDEAIYIGRIPTHFGHFLMEGMARLCDVVNLNKPIIGYITDGYLPEGIKPTPQKEIRWVINSATNEFFYEIGDDNIYLVETLYVPTLPYHLSHSCSEPWRMSSIIKKIVDIANELYGTVGSNTHLSIFAKSDAKTYWTPRGSYQDSDRNQLICDLIKTYNEF